jgi:hypothetical protein
VLKTQKNSKPWNRCKGLLTSFAAEYEDLGLSKTQKWHTSVFFWHTLDALQYNAYCLTTASGTSSPSTIWRKMNHNSSQWIDKLSHIQWLGFLESKVYISLFLDVICINYQVCVHVISCLQNFCIITIFGLSHLTETTSKGAEYNLQFFHIICFIKNQKDKTNYGTDETATNITKHILHDGCLISIKSAQVTRTEWPVAS